MKIKVSELEGEKLAEWVARAQKWVVLESPDRQTLFWLDPGGDELIRMIDYRPDINGGQAMELLEKYGSNIAQGLWYIVGSNTGAFLNLKNKKLVLVRAFVASEYGEYVEDV